MQYTTGNLARKIEKPVEEPVKKLRAKRVPFLNFKLLGIVLVCFAVAMLIQWRDGKVFEMRRDIQASQQILFRLEAKNKQEQLEMERKMDLKEVEAIATTRLNMHKPAKNQIVYVNVEKPDVAEVVNKSEDNSVFAMLSQGVGSIMEYLQ